MSDAATPNTRDAGDFLDAERLAQAEAKGLDGAPVTQGLLIVNVLVFAFELYLAGGARAAWAVPDEVLKWLGANDALSTIADTRLETLVTSCFLHASIFHLALNLVALWVVSPFVERVVGPARFFVLYLVSGVVGSAASAIYGRFFGPGLSVGASGAICGLMGAAIVVGVRAGGWKSPHAHSMARWLGLLLVVGLVKYLRGDILQVDNAAHVGGAVAGAVVATTWRREPYPRRTQHAIVAACMLLVLASSLVVDIRDQTDPYLFLDVRGRVRAAYDALGAGDCRRARTAIHRALAMDPESVALRGYTEDIERTCREGNAPDPASSLMR